MAAPLDRDSYQSGQLNSFFKPTRLPHELFDIISNTGYSGEYNILINPTSGSIPKTYPKALRDNLASKVSNPKKISSLRHTRGDKIIVSTSDPMTASEITNIKLLLSIPTTTNILTENVTSRFLLQGIPVGVSLQDLAEEIEEVNNISILEARRFQKRSKTSFIPTESVLITTFGVYLPQKIKLWYEIRTINLFIDRPRMCTNCCAWDHNIKICSKPRKCLRCSENHDPQSCNSASLLCPNCNLNHPANDEACQSKIDEKNFLKFKCTNHLSFAEARRLYRTPSQPNTMAQVISTPNLSNYVTKAELQKSLEDQTIKIESIIAASLQQQAALFREVIENLNEKVLALLPHAQVGASSPERKKQARKPNLASLTPMECETSERLSPTVSLPPSNVSNFQPSTSQSSTLHLPSTSSNTSKINTTNKINPISRSNLTINKST